MWYFNQQAGTEEDLALLVACMRSCARIEKGGEKEISSI